MANALQLHQMQIPHMQHLMRISTLIEQAGGQVYPGREINPHQQSLLNTAGLCRRRAHLKCVASCVFRTGSISTSFTTMATSDPEKPSVRRASSSKSR